MPKFKKFAETTYTVPMAKREKYKKMNPKTNRMKKFSKTRQMVTEIPPEERSFKNIPKYATGKTKVKFQDWLEIEHDEKGSSYGKAKNGKCYGWSHRAVYGFKAGDEVKGDNLGKKVDYPKLPDGQLDFDKPSYEPDFTIKDDAHAMEVAKTFADNVS